MHIVHTRIVSLAECPHLLPVVAEWIYNEWWRDNPAASTDTVADLLRSHLAPDTIPFTLVAQGEGRPVGTATVIPHDVGTEQWPDFSPWLADVYVVPKHRGCGIGTSLVKAATAKAAALGVGTLYLATSGQTAFYARLGWEVIDRNINGFVMMRRLRA